ncbi:quercetin dioxygenase-like cupin family protein [Thermocatellispora tengchongensis]|uniref:Quercetin dioxygenase-like cupin family protein n=1 Tax=Thermocatellispora tengchongensis TaxID=1073253 RepID=A0A840PBA3_9ACTN|nr:AraC family ligand binding domain-containing protein [Thermocatellispora tengchongensis]MBB5134690.1 quercetin dioxygenase-like cupin family protein [Thermocatellispora tengchongensis]
MGRLIDAATRIPVPGGKTIDEYVGRVNSGDERVSIAHMKAPAGWTEEPQTPSFAEFTLVLRGSVLVEQEGGTVEVRAGQAYVSEPGEKIRYSSGPEGAEYVAVCLPAFSPESANREA